MAESFQQSKAICDDKLQLSECQDHFVEFILQSHISSLCVGNSLLPLQGKLLRKEKQNTDTLFVLVITREKINYFSLI